MRGRRESMFLTIETFPSPCPSLPPSYLRGRLDCVGDPWMRTLARPCQHFCYSRSAPIVPCNWSVERRMKRDCLRMGYNTFNSFNVVLISNVSAWCSGGTTAINWRTYSSWRLLRLCVSRVSYQFSLSYWIPSLSSNAWISVRPTSNIEIQMRRQISVSWKPIDSWKAAVRCKLKVLKLTHIVKETHETVDKVNVIRGQHECLTIDHHFFRFWMNKLAIWIGPEALYKCSYVLLRAN